MAPRASSSEERTVCPGWNGEKCTQDNSDLPRSYRYKRDCIKHFKVVHLGLKLQCPAYDKLTGGRCEHTSIDVNALRRHMNCKHFTVKPWFCTVCGPNEKRWTDKVEATRHQDTTGHAFQEDFSVPDPFQELYGVDPKYFARHYAKTTVLPTPTDTRHLSDAEKSFFRRGTWTMRDPSTGEVIHQAKEREPLELQEPAPPGLIEALFGTGRRNGRRNNRAQQPQPQQQQQQQQQPQQQQLVNPAWPAPLETTNIWQHDQLGWQGLMNPEPTSGPEFINPAMLQLEQPQAQPQVQQQQQQQETTPWSWLQQDYHPVEVQPPQQQQQQQTPPYSWLQQEYYPVEVQQQQQQEQPAAMTDAGWADGPYTLDDMFFEEAMAAIEGFLDGQTEPNAHTDPSFAAI